MDKKLILDIGNIEYISKKSKINNSFEDLKKDIQLLPQILKLFQNINIEKLKIDGNEFKIILNENDLYLDNKFVNISSKIDISSKQITFDLYSLYLKDLALFFDGKIKVDYFNEKLNYFGNFYYENIQSNLNIEMNEKLIKFYLVSETFKNLQFLKKYLELPEIAEQWMYENVQGDMKLENFYGEYDLQKNEIIEKSLKGKAQIQNAKIRFHKNVDEIMTKNIDIFFKDDKLYFDLIEPKFKDKDITGSYVTINNLTSALNGEVEVFIQTNNMLDKDILNILKAYDIHLPIIQKSGITQAKLLLKFPYIEEKPMTTKGNFLVNNSEFFINNFSFNTQNAHIILDDSIVHIKDADFKHKNMIDAFVNLDIDTKTLKSSGSAMINSFLIKKDDGEKIVEIKEKKTSVNLDFNKEVNIDLVDLDTKIKVADFVYVDIKNLSKIYPYSNLLKDISAKDGNISLIIKDDKNIKFKAFVQGFNFPLEKNGYLLKELDIVGSLEDKNIFVSTVDEDIKLEIKDDIKLFLNNLNISIDTKKQKSDFPKKINIYLGNSNLKIDETTYTLKKADVHINKNQIDFDVIVKNLDIPLKKDNKNIEELELVGSYNKDITKINTKNNDLFLELKNDFVYLDIDGYDIYYSSKNDFDEKFRNIDLIAENSNIIVDDKYKILADNYGLRLRKDSKFIYLKHKETQVSFKEYGDKRVDIFADELSEEFINSIFAKNIVNGGNILFFANGSLDNLNGKIIIENSNVEDLAILNNLLMFIHTSPALINPLLAIPSVVGMATNSGFNLTAYKITNGTIDFNYNKKNNLIDVKKLLTIGNGIDFDGKGRIDLGNLTLDTQLKLIFLKDYSSIVGAVPVVNYVLLGDNNRVETQVNISGDLNNPEISTNLTKDTFNIPMNIAKRVFSSPSMFLDFMSGKDSQDEEKLKEEFINKPLK